MKTRKIIFFAVLVAMVLALTGCGLPSELQGVYAPAKLIRTQSGHTTITETFDWNAGTYTTTQTSVFSGYSFTYAYAMADVYNVTGSTAQLAQPITTDKFQQGIDGITWYDSDHDKEVEVDGDKVIIGDWLFNDTFEPSDDPNYRFVVTKTISSSNTTYKIYYNIY